MAGSGGPGAVAAVRAMMIAATAVTVARRDDGRRNGGRRPGEGPQIPEIDELMKRGTEHLRVLMGGRAAAGSLRAAAAVRRAQWSPVRA